jgi:ADP-heptose:LPS heptosyltransferase
MNAKTIILSRTDSLGDVVLTLPMAGAIKKQQPKTKIVFLGKTYSKPLIETSAFVDDFVNYDELLQMNEQQQLQMLKQINANAIVHVFPNKKLASLAKKAKIPIRIGTSHRTFHLLSCNKLINLGRKNSELHEAQLNLKLLAPLGLRTDYSLADIPNFYGFEKLPDLPAEIKKLISHDKFNLILHPKSKGSAREWGLENFEQLIRLLPQSKFKVFVSGTKEESLLMKDFLERNKNILTDLTGKLNLSELIGFIGRVNGLVAASTGPLHIAAATGIRAIGIFAPMHPIHPGRWKPLGKKAGFLVLDKKCNDCKNGGPCSCILSISPNQVFEKIMH